MAGKKSAARTEAVAKGLTTYFTGEPCVNGHVAHRAIGDWKCLACKAERQARWVKANPDRMAASHQRWVAKDPERAAEFARKRVAKSRAKHIEKRRDEDREAKKLWRKANPDLCRARNAANLKQYASRPENWPKLVAKTHRYMARLRGAPGTFTHDDVERLLEQQGFRCNGCSQDLLRSYHVDHVVPLIRGGSNWPHNLQVLCHRCNCSKGTLTMDEWCSRKVKE